MKKCIGMIKIFKRKGEKTMNFKHEKPRLLDIYESKDCDRIIAPYIVKDLFFNIAESILKNNKKVFDALETIPEVSLVSGNLCNQRNNQHNSNQYNGSNLTWNNEGCTEVNDKILPPHKVTCSPGKSIRFESNIYNPCLEPVVRSESSSGIMKDSTTFPTGQYPNDIPNYPVLNETDWSIIQEIKRDNCNCHKKNYEDLSKEKSVLQHELYAWLEGIQKAQISNLMLSIISANKIPLDVTLISTFQHTLECILTTRLHNNVKKIGILTYTQRTISAPHIRTKFYVFIQVNLDDESANQFADTISQSLSVPMCEPPIMVVTEKTYEIMRQYYPINVCFECIPGYITSSNIPTFEMLLVNDNLFIPKIHLRFNQTTNAIKMMSPSDCICISSGSSGSISFLIGSEDINDKYSVSTIHINDHNYSLTELLEAHDNPESNITAYEFSSINATFVDQEHQIFTIYYKNLTSDITISIDPMIILSDKEFDIDRKNIKSRISQLLSMGLFSIKTKTVIPQSSQDESLKNDETGDLKEDISDDNEHSDETSPKTLYAITLNIPFTGNCRKINLSNIKLYQVLRIDSISCPVYRSCTNALIGTSNAPAVLMCDFVGNSLSNNKELVVTNNYIGENSEYLLVIEQEALELSPLNDRSNTYQRIQAANQRLELRFAVNIDTQEIEFLEGDQLPSFIVNDMPTPDDSSQE